MSRPAEEVVLIRPPRAAIAPAPAGKERTAVHDKAVVPGAEDVIHVQENAPVDKEERAPCELFLNPSEGNPDAEGPRAAADLRVVAAGGDAGDVPKRDV